MLTELMLAWNSYRNTGRHDADAAKDASERIDRAVDAILAGEPTSLQDCVLHLVLLVSRLDDVDDRTTGLLRRLVDLADMPEPVRNLLDHYV